MPSEQTEELGELQGAYDTTLTAHQVEVNVAKAKRVAKDESKRESVAFVRTLVKQLQVNPALTDFDREQLGITVPKTVRTPVGVPTSRPHPEVERIEELEHELRLTDDETNRATKPDGVTAAEVWMKLVPLGGPAPVDPSELTLISLATTPRLTTTFSPADAGKTAYYRCRWVNTKGQPGGWGNQVGATVAA